MSVFSALYKSVSGLMGFNQGLDNLSNNVANMNTPGFKGKDQFFRELASGGSGDGVKVSGSSIRMQQGDIAETGNATDVAIDGNGFFILQQGSDTFYTRNGQFRLDDNGYLVDSTSGLRVAAYEAGGQLKDFRVNRNQTVPPIATSSIQLSGNLDASASQGDTYPADPIVDPLEVTIFDHAGIEQTLRFVWTKGVGNTWTVQPKNSSNTDIGTPTVIAFDADGSPAAGSNSFAFTYAGVAGEPIDITVELGATGEFSGLTGFSSGTSSLESSNVDGRSLGRMIDIAFDQNGQLTLTFSNGEVLQGDRLALAHFSNVNELSVANGSVFKAQAGSQPDIGVANSGVFGSISAASIELSNVELSKEFADLIIVQRGYQACSQVMNVTNELVEELYNSTRGG
jgi:flagellar hook protein FlgE